MSLRVEIDQADCGGLFACNAGCQRVWALDRLTSRTYPDETTDTRAYARLNLAERRDRLGRSTRYFYDTYGRPTATRDPADVNA